MTNPVLVFEKGSGFHISRAGCSITGINVLPRELRPVAEPETSCLSLSRHRLQQPHVTMKRFHLIFGIAALFVFILSGQYMDKVYGHLRGMADAPRMLFRSRHIYILFASLLNLSLGTYLKPQQRDWRRGHPS